MQRRGYCPWCGWEIQTYSFEAHSRNRIWEKCPNPRCSGTKIELTTDEDGFVIEPLKMRGRYVFSKPRS